MLDQKDTSKLSTALHIPSDEQVNELLQKMTLEEKITLTVGFDNWNTNAVERLNIPSITMNDGPHGLRKPPSATAMGLGDSIAATCFPPAASTAASWDPDLLESMGQALAEECLAQNVQVILGPGVNIKRTPLGGRNFEYFSEDPLVAGEMGAALVRGIQSKGVGTSVKHYACNNQEWERMSISVDVDERTLRELYLPAFERIVKAVQPWTIMAAYNKVNGVYATEHRQLLQDILKNEWGFEGVIVSDWGAVVVRPTSLAAGLDLEMPGPGGTTTEAIARLVRAGQLAEGAIDAAAFRVLRLMLRGEANRKPGSVLDGDAHHALARKAAAEAMVLLKNDNNALPLDPQHLASVAVIGGFAKVPRYQGSGSSQVVPTRLDNPYDEIQHWLGDKVNVTYAEGYSDSDQIDERLLADAASKAKAASIAIVFVGLPDSYESEGIDRLHLSLPETHNRLISEVCRAQPNTIIILLNGSPVAMPWLAAPRAILEAGLGGQAMGGAVVDILSGKVSPSGKLAETFPVRLEDTPAFLNYPGEAGVVRYGEGLFVGYRYYDAVKIAPLFPFGFGLSYTTFEYSGLRTSKTELRPGESLDVEFTVRNTGKRSGKEVAQLYLQPLASQFRRPVKELKAFAKVAVDAGETVTVRLTLQDRDFMVFDPERHAWRMEGGTFQILVGGSSVDLPLSSAVTVWEDPQSARRHFTRMTAIMHFLDDPVGHDLALGVFAGTWMLNALNRNPDLFGSMPICKLGNFARLPSDAINKVVEQVNRTPLP